MIDRSSSVPLYLQLADTLRAQIAAGAIVSGDKLPSEHQLCERHDLSRSVVRQALQSLVHAGLIETERGRGAFVKDRKVPITLQQRLDPLQEGMARAGFRLTTRVLRLEAVQPPAHVSREIGEGRAVYLERLRYADGQLLLVVQNYLPHARFASLLTFEGLDTTSLYVWLREACGVIASTGRRTIEIGRADPHVATLLDLPPGERVLFNRETTFDQDGQPIEYYESWHHPDRTRLSIDLYRQAD